MTMNQFSVFVVIFTLFISRITPCLAVGRRVADKRITAKVTVMGLVYCDICSNNSFTKLSYSIPGTEVRIDCKFKANFPRTREQISFTVNRTTNRRGIYKLEIPSVDGIQCTQAAIASSCLATLISTSSTSCNLPGPKTTTDHITFKARSDNFCVYSFDALSFRPSKKDRSLCGS